MKKIKVLSLFVLTSLIFSSCSNEENVTVQNPDQNLLKSFKVKRDATGAYSVDFDVNTNTKVDKVVNTRENASEFYLYSSEDQLQSNISQNLLIDNNELKISFIEADNNKTRNVSIQDDITLLNKSSENDKLASYEISTATDGNFELNFSVNDNVNVSFGYNNNTDTYEVHLTSGKGGESHFSRVLEKNDNVLKLDFVNHISNSGAKGAEAMIRKPKIIIDGID